MLTCVVIYITVHYIFYDDVRRHDSSKLVKLHVLWSLLPNTHSSTSGLWRSILVDPCVPALG